MKKLLLVLLVAGMAVSGCKKDPWKPSTLSQADIATVNAQLKGTWVFPFRTLTVVDSAGKAVLPVQNIPAAAFAFDGLNTV